MNIEQIILEPWKIDQKKSGNCGFAMMLMHLSIYHPDYIRWLNTQVVTPLDSEVSSQPLPIPSSPPSQKNVHLTDRVVMNAQRRLDKRRFFNFPNEVCDTNWENYRDWYLIVSLVLIFKQICPAHILEMCKKFGYYLYEKTPEKTLKLKHIIDDIHKKYPMPTAPDDDPDYDPGFDFDVIAIDRKRNSAIQDAKSEFGHISLKSGTLALNTLGLHELIRIVDLHPLPNGVVSFKWNNNVLSHELLPAFKEAVRIKSRDLLNAPTHKFNQFCRSQMKPLFTSMKPGSGAFLAVRVLQLDTEGWQAILSTFIPPEKACSQVDVPIEFEVPHIPWYDHWVYCWKPKTTAHHSADNIEIWTWGSKYTVSLDSIFHFFTVSSGEKAGSAFGLRTPSEELLFSSLTVLVPSYVVTFPPKS